MEGDKMLGELEARRILAEHRIERGIDDYRSCAEIVETLQLLPKVEPVVEPTPPDAVE